MDLFMVVVELLRRLSQKAGPYLFVEMLLPGGTLIALALFFYRRGRIFSVPLSIRGLAVRLLGVTQRSDT